MTPVCCGRLIDGVETRHHAQREVKSPRLWRGCLLASAVVSFSFVVSSDALEWSQILGPM